MYTQEFSTALNRCCKHNGQSARRCRCQQKPDAAQSPHTVNRRSVSGQRSKYVVDRRSRYENRTSRFNTYCCDIGVNKCFLSQNQPNYTTRKACYFWRFSNMLGAVFSWTQCINSFYDLRLEKNVYINCAFIEVLYGECWNCRTRHYATGRWRIGQRLTDFASQK